MLNRLIARDKDLMEQLVVSFVQEEARQGVLQKKNDFQSQISIVFPYTPHNQRPALDVKKSARFEEVGLKNIFLLLWQETIFESGLIATAEILGRKIMDAMKHFIIISQGGAENTGII